MSKKNNEKRKLTKPEKKARNRRIINTICILFLSAGVTLSLGVFLYIQNVLGNSTLPSDLSDLESANSTIILDRNGNEITTLSAGSGYRENIDYEVIPQVVLDAFLSAEDSRFFEHSGFDLPRFISSGFANLSAGGIVQGGSTLTMQLIDVAFFQEAAATQQLSTFEQLENKILEIFKSVEVETANTKEEIIEDYLNKINFGGSARGIEKGAQYYFGKSVQNLTLSEAAYLAGVVNAPSAYNAYYNYDLGVERRDTILYLMHYHGYISQEEYELALQVDLSKQLNGVVNFEGDANQSFIDHVVQEVEATTGYNPYTTSMVIQTTMDPEAQAVADALCNGEGVTYPDDLFQTGFAAINNQTGEILALGGGRGYGGSDRINRAYGDIHQIGSTAKPLVAYAPAFEYVGYSTSMVLEDGPIDNWADGTTLYNADRRFRGDVTLSSAIGLSLNLPAYHAFMDTNEIIGNDAHLKLIQDLGFDLDTLNPSVAIGTFSATPLQVAGAYQTFASAGQYIEPYSVVSIDFQDETIEDYANESAPTQIFSAETAYLTSVMLKDAVDNASYQTLVNTLKSSYPVYGKSGTTSYGDEAAQYGIPIGIAKDKWMVGYTNQYTVAAWVGYDKPIAGMNTYLDETKLWANVEGTIVKTMLDTLTAGESVSEITRPSGVVSISHILGLFPYATAPEGNSVAMTSGLINQKFASLDTVSPDELSTLDSLSISMNENDLTIRFTPYPDASKLVKASNVKTMSGGGVTVSGTLLFDKSFLFGAVQYKWDIYVNGTLVKNGASASDQNVETISTKNGDTVRVCGYYGYEHVSNKSNEVCQELKSSVSEELVVPSSFESIFAGKTTFESAKSSVVSFANTYFPGISVSIIENNTVEAGQYDKANSTLLPGTTLKEDVTYYVSIGSK